MNLLLLAVCPDHVPELLLPPTFLNFACCSLLLQMCHKHALLEFSSLPSAMAVGKHNKSGRQRPLPSADRWQSNWQPFIRQRGALSSVYYRWMAKGFAIRRKPLADGKEAGRRRPLSPRPLGR